MKNLLLLFCLSLVFVSCEETEWQKQKRGVKSMPEFKECKISVRNYVDSFGEYTDSKYLAISCKGYSRGHDIIFIDLVINDHGLFLKNLVYPSFFDSNSCNIRIRDKERNKYDYNIGYDGHILTKEYAGYWEHSESFFYDLFEQEEDLRATLSISGSEPIDLTIYCYGFNRQYERYITK